MTQITTSENVSPLAAYVDGMELSTFGKREYRLFPDSVAVGGSHWGAKFEAKVSLSELLVEPQYVTTHSQTFKFGAYLIMIMLLLLSATFLIFGNYEHKFTIWYLSSFVLLALGFGLCWISFRSISKVTFTSKSGLPMLTVVAHKTKRTEQDAFVAAIQNEIIKCTEARKE